MNVVIVNKESTPIPPYGVVELVGIESSGDFIGIAKAYKPSRSGATNVFFNGAAAIPPNSAGSVHQTFPTIAAYQTDNETSSYPLPGEQWGVKASSFYLHKLHPGFTVVGGAGNNSRLMSIVRGQVRTVDFVRVTSTTQTSDRYPGKLQTYDAVAKSWSDGNDIWIVDPNDNDLGEKIGEATLAGFANDRAVYVASANLWDDGECS